MKSLTQQRSFQVSLCAHCGESILHTTITDHEQSFCCEACLWVYNYIKDQHLDFYYELGDTAGFKPPKGADQTRYLEWVDSIADNSEWTQWGSGFNTRRIITLHSEEIHCAACAWLGNQVITKYQGIHTHQIDPFRGYWFLTVDPRAFDMGQFLKEMARLGYRFKPVFEDDQTIHTAAVSHEFIKKFAVAVFCFMNTMIYTAALYLGEYSGIEPTWQRLFQWVIFAFSIPSIIYSARPFYLNTFYALKNFRITFDLPVTLGISLAFIVSVYQLCFNQGTIYFDSTTGLIAFLLAGQWFVKHMECKFTIDPLWIKAQFRRKVKCVREDKIQWVTFDELRPGDVFHLYPDELCLVDAILQSEEGVFDTSLLTGETIQHKVTRHGFVHAGYRNKTQTLTLKTHTPYSETSIQFIQRSLENLEATPDQSLSSHFNHLPLIFTLTILSLALCFFFHHLPAGFIHALNHSISLLIMTCPCAIVLSEPFFLGMTLLELKAHGIQFKQSQKFKDLRHIKSVILDKTGTITFYTRKIKQWVWIESSLTVEKSKLLVLIKSLTAFSLHPCSQAIHNSISGSYVTVRDFREITGYGIQAMVDGHTLEIVKNAPEKVPEYPAGTVIILDHVPVGVVMFEDLVKPGVKSMIDWMKNKNMNIYLLSGDHRKNVQKISEDLGIAHMHAGLTPQDKLKILLGIKSNGPVLCIGDGFNDQLMLEASDISIAMCEGVMTNLKTADILMTGQAFPHVRLLFNLSMHMTHTVRIAYIISLLYNLLAIYLVYRGYIHPVYAAILMPLSTLSVFFTIFGGIFSIKKLP